jgi:hypothetical protein
LATPFVQGQLRGQTLSVSIESTCGHCDRSLHITVDSDMRHQVREADADPLVFMPDIDWPSFTEPNIIHAY